MGAALRKAGESCNRLVASSTLTARIYFSLLPYLSPWFGQKTQQRLRNSINSVNWPQIPLRYRRVTLGNETEVVLYPHFQEFDLEALLSRRLHYEQEVFAFLETQMPKYQSVIEIGANVGVFSVFFSRWLARHAPLGKVFAFEPSRRAYARLLQNLELNASTNVMAFNCAVGRDSGFSTFFEPDGHLTNGSLDAAFARQFSPALKAAPVLVVKGSLIENLIGAEDPVLLKLDVEGAEAQVLRSLEGFIRSRQPDLVVEVLPGSEEELNALSFLNSAGYHFFNIMPKGLVRQTSLVAGVFRDYFLSTSARGSIHEDFARAVQLLS